MINDQLIYFKAPFYVFSNYFFNYKEKWQKKKNFCFSANELYKYSLYSDK